ncbi:Pectate lyase [Lasiodiplodia theobromae]|uniref:pectate lyase n=1 Tax=Lasiodiplodia theobromae TaxID=45133 RepID=A0A5N5DA84_9PEZI|nr:Pectate lyase [Lasiodiplodia theobromae]KAB2574515.1 putative pectate lyase A [Lasiodiplodia theobromae]KAF4536970.1 Pectate lyase [Lasiodiplodia theobromae]
MKASTVATIAISAVSALAAPTKTLGKRAAITDTPDVGFATLNGGTTGGAGGSTTTVSTLAQFTAAAEADGAAVIVVSGAISGSAKVRVASDKTIIGKDSSAVLTNVGLYINKVKNVIVRNLTIKKVVADNGDAIGIQESENVWIDHCDLSSDQENGKDYYDGLLDVTHAADYITLSNNYLHDHYKASLVGHSDSNGSEDKGHLTVTYVGNHFENLNSRGPSYRFGTGHILNNLYTDVSDGINTRQGAQLLVEGNVFVNPKKPLYSTDAGYAVSVDNDFGSGENTAEEGTISSSDLGYDYTALASSAVSASVKASAGATLSF